MRRIALLIGFALLLGCPPKPPPYPECRNDEDCKGHDLQVCMGGTCKECRDDSQCSQKPGTTCQGSICVAKAQCQSNRDCGEGQKCSADKKCVAECSEASAAQDCGPDKICRAGRCADQACQADADCGSGKACVNNVCKTPSGAQGGTSACELKTVYFGFDEATLSQEARVILDTDWQCLAKQPGRVTVAGNTDERGTTEYNLALGERRAEAVRKYLIGLGADAQKIKPLSYGKERPVDSGHDESAWAKNRRVEITAEGGR
jgi:peptidoglycan-associated lipoprotein